MPSSSPGNPLDRAVDQREVRDVNEALIAMSVRQHELIEEANLARRKAETLAAELRASEARLRESERRFRMVADNIAQLAWTCDTLGNVTWYNQRWLDYTGLTFEATKGYGWSKVHHPDHLDRVVAGVKRSAETGEPWEDTFPLRGKDGNYRWFLSRAVPIRDETGNIARWFGTNTDVTELRNAEQALRQSQAWLAGQKEAFSSAVSGEALEVSLGVLARLAREQMGDGARAGFYLADGARKQLHHVAGMPEDYAECVDGFPIGPDSPACGLAAFKGEPVITADVMTDPLWEQWRWLAEKYDFRACWSFPIQTLAGKIVGTLALYLRQPRAATPRDHALAAILTRAAAIIIAQSDAAVERARADAALREADRRKSEFLAMLAHELRNPLAPILNAVHVLQISDGAGEFVQSASEMMERQVSQMVRLVDDLLDVSRINRGKIELRQSRVELTSIVQQAVEAIHPLVQSLGLELTVTLPPHRIDLDADATRLAQVVGNLLTNACKFTDKGGRISLIVEVARRVTSVSADEAVIRVRDSGIGIAAEQLPCIFDMFMQVDTSLERSVSGLGIGLTLVKELVELHGGTVEVHSGGLGQGSEFVVRLPIPVETPKQPPLDPTASGPPSTTARRILVVDDNRDSAESLAMLLKLMSNVTRTAHDGLEAVEAAATFQPDVVLLDIGLPKLNGYEACRRIRNEPWGKNMVLVALTGWGQDEDRQKSHDAGFDGHLVKPVGLDALAELLAGLAGK